MAQIQEEGCAPEFCFRSKFQREAQLFGLGADKIIGGVECTVQGKSGICINVSHVSIMCV